MRSNPAQKEAQISKLFAQTRRSCLLFVVALLFAGAINFSTRQIASAQQKRGTEVVQIPGETGDDKAIPLYAESWALVIGVGKYSNGWPGLDGAAKDMKRVSTALEKQGFKVEILPDPTRDTLNQTMERFINEHGSTGSENNRLLIYFAGHGSTLTNRDGRQLGFIVPADAPLPEKDEREFRRLAISMDKIEGYARDILAKHVLFVFDSCFSGTLFEAIMRSGPTAAISNKTIKPVRQFITAGTKDQKVPDESIFCTQFLNGLDGSADLNKDGYVTGEELGMFVQDQVTNYSRRTQTPRHGKIRDEKLDQGDFVFILPPPEIVSSPVEAKTALPKLMVQSGQLSSVEAAAFSGDGRLVLLGDGDHTVHLWDLITGQETRRFRAHTAAVESVTFSPDAKFALTAGKDGNAYLWDVASGREVRRFNECAGTSQSIAISPDGRLILMAGTDHKARLIDIATGQEVRRLGGPGEPVSSVLFSLDGRLAATGGRDGVVRFWELATGKQMRQIKTGLRSVEAIAISPDQSLIATVNSESPESVRLWEFATGRDIRAIEARGAVRSIDFSPDGRLILTGVQGCADRTASLWDVATGLEVRQLSGQSDMVNTVSFSPSGRFALTGEKGGVARLWDISTAKEISRLMPFRNGNWAVADPEGRFDVSDLDDRSLYWLTPDNPLKPFPLELFMREFYEPGLLSRALSGEKFRPLAALEHLNRALPLLKVAQIEAQPNAPDRVAITIEVAKGVAEFRREGRLIPQESGVYNLRLFRDDQLVGAHDGEIKLDPNGKATLVFRNIRLPRNVDPRQVEFSAYAFNSDRIKSETSRRTFTLPKELTPQKGRAYVITVGVNAYDDARFDLRYAADDARSIGRLLNEALTKVGDYREVIPISLISGGEAGSDGKDVPEKLATKANIRAVLDLLSGRSVDPRLRSIVPGAENFQPASPDDLIIIYFAGHGYADQAGNFYFLPSDTGQMGREGMTGEMSKRFVSSDELALWLRDVDAGHIAMIIDASHSAAAVANGEFKPGVMGSRGLGQLAYEKGMRILTASQADNVAIESAQLRQGLLAYSLIEGLSKKAADFHPPDGIITLGEWLEYGVERVPNLSHELTLRMMKSRGDVDVGTTQNVEQIDPERRQLRDQRPVLFAFGKQRRDVVLDR